MDVNITVLACLKLIPVHEKLAVQFLVQFVEDQASLGSDKSAVRISVALVPDVADGLTLRIYFIHHVDEIRLVISVITVALGNCRIYLFQRALYDVVHVCDRYLFLAQSLCMLRCKLADE